MSVIQPQIIYTGLNAARPDFKGMIQDMNKRVDMVRREKQQQRQWDQQRQDQLNRDFLDTVDVNRINLTNANLQQQALNVYKNFDDTVASMVKAKKGNLTTQDIMNGKALATSAMQNVAKFKNWEDNWNKDQAAIAKDKEGIFDKEAAKREIFDWNGDTPYNKSRLKIAAWDKYQTYNALSEDVNKAEVVSTFSYFNGGGDIKSQGEFDRKFWDHDIKDINGKKQAIPITDENGNWKPNYKEQGEMMKDFLGSQRFVQAREGLNKRYSELSAEEQNMWDMLAANNGLSTKGQGDGEIMYMLSPQGENMSSMFSHTDEPTAYKETDGNGDKTVVYRNAAGDRVPGLLSSRTTSFDGKSFDNVYDLKEGIQLQEGVNLNGAMKIGDNGELVAVSDKESKTYDNPTLMATNTTDDGKIDKVFIRTRSPKYKTTTKGEQIYQWGDKQGTEEMLYEDLAKEKNVSVSDLSPAMKSYYKNSFFEPIESGSKYETVVVPAYENKFLLQNFVVEGSTGVYEPTEQNGDNKVVLQEGSLDEL